MGVLRVDPAFRERLTDLAHRAWSFGTDGTERGTAEKDAAVEELIALLESGEIETVLPEVCPCPDCSRRPRRGRRIGDYSGNPWHCESCYIGHLQLPGAGDDCGHCRPRFEGEAG